MHLLTEEEEMAKELGREYDQSKKYADDTLGEKLKTCSNVCEKIIYKSIYSNWMN